MPQAPESLVADLLAELGRRFYQGKPVKVWMQDQKPLLLALTWPAGWLQQRGVSLPVARYGEILREVISGIGTHGDLAKIEHFPSYLLHCVRLWFVHHGEDLYYRQKSIRDAIDLAVLQRGSAQPASALDPIEALAAAHRVLATRKRPAKTRPVDSGQTTFF
ncbi:MAG: hypothetical protein HZC55_04295 [Verrucomicrobia bacterium]|nr:hypothetical protein [Verrucomicrobiota bacterium]